jgi:23S rRNA (adenine2030-N6)-methyltransferase
MNYRHHYHAGNIADLIKHATLAHLLLRLRTKEAPFGVIDTHAAAGSYDLRAIESQKTKEALSGAYAFAKLPSSEALKPLQDVMAKWNLGIHFGKEFTEDQLRYYPGSPAIIQHYLRPDDKLIAVEKHPEEAKKLRKMLSPFPNATLHERDGWEAMVALLPLKETRALVFIDPPYEQPDEMDKAVEVVLKAYARSATAMYALWYPLTDNTAVAKMKEDFTNSPVQKILCCEAEFAPGENLKGCGMILINPPWQIENALAETLNLLKPLFAEGSAPAEITWLKQ